MSHRPVLKNYTRKSKLSIKGTLDKITYAYYALIQAFCEVKIKLLLSYGKIKEAWREKEVCGGEDY